MASDCATYLAHRGSILVRGGPTSLKTQCIFHSEREPSLTLYENNHFICYGCRTKGDFVELIRLVEFPGLPWHEGIGQAFKVRDALTGERSTPYTKAQRIDRRPTRADKRALWIAQRHYRALLEDNPTAQAYLRERGVEQWSELPLGAAGHDPQDYLSLTGELQVQLGEHWHEVATKVGLIGSRGQERLHDRIIFWEEQQHQVVYYAARSLLPENVRYLAPPNLAKTTLGSFSLPWPSKAVALVEGPFDAAPFWGAHYPTLALLGSELRDPLELLSFLHGRYLQLLTDADPAGEAAAATIIETLDAFHIPYLRVRPRHGKDPNAWVLHEGISQVLSSLP